MVRSVNAGDRAIDYLRDITNPQLTFNENVDYETWKEQIKSKFLDLTGYNLIKENACPSNIKIEEEVECDGYKRIRFIFNSENGVVVPAYLLIPNTGKEKYPVAITLQGHSTGFHNSVGIVKFEQDKDYIEDRGDFAVQAVKQGYVALSIEQRGMGEVKPDGNGYRNGQMCVYTADIMFMLGRTLVASRCWDISRAIDCLSNFKECDLDKILITGNSGGGTASYYAACLDERIKLSVPSCAVSTYKKSILNQFHCACNFIPSAYRYFEMADISCMLAPRQLIVVTGSVDSIFPIQSTYDAFDTIKKIYKKAGKAENCKLVVTPKGHWWCKDIVWNEIKNKTTEMGWWK